ncbi:MAG: DUF6496 domain-containing protein [Pseudomonadota bacterium]
MARRYGKSVAKNVERVMKKRKKGTLKSGRSRKVRSRKQAIAIALSESRRAGEKAPKKSKRKKAGRKTSRNKTSRKRTSHKRMARPT